MDGNSSRRLTLSESLETNSTATAITTVTADHHVAISNSVWLAEEQTEKERLAEEKRTKERDEEAMEEERLTEEQRGIERLAGERREKESRGEEQREKARLTEEQTNKAEAEGEGDEDVDFDNKSDLHMSNVSLCYTSFLVRSSGSCLKNRQSGASCACCDFCVFA